MSPPARHEAEVALEPIRAEKLSEAVYDQLEGLIVSEKLAPGQRLPSERALAVHLGVSRSSIREAILELELKRFVERKPGRGTVVLQSRPPLDSNLLADLTDEQRDVIEIMDFRLAVEPPIAALAAQRVSHTSLSALAEILDLMVDSTDRRRTAELDEEFHAAIAGATNNRLLMRLHQETSKWLQHIRREALQTAGRRVVSLAGHRRIYEAIAAGDSPAAAAAVAEHVMQVRNTIEDATTKLELKRRKGN
jgi:GntR family transcriptional repressor for pyruvate dehydrogenase complex